MGINNDKIPDVKRRFYGRRLSRPLRSERQDAMDALYPQISIEKEALEAATQIDPQDLFQASVKAVYFEIGFGSGEHLHKLVNRYPDIGFIGAEPFINGMGAFMKALANDDLYNNEVPLNLRVFMDDALLLTDKLKEQSLDKIYVLNPDPWPKKRHHKRRIINQDNLTSFARVMKPGAELIMATDVDSLAAWMKDECEAHNDFDWAHDAQNNVETPPTEWIETRYAFKGRTEGRTQSFLRFVRK